MTASTPLAASAPLTASGAAPAGQVAEPKTALRLLLTIGQLAALLVVVRVFELENRTVFYILVGAVAGFAVHALLPTRYQLPFFAALSAASIPIVLGLPAGATVLALGLLLIGACHLPIGFNLRLGLIVLLAVVMMAFRNSTGLSGLPPVVLSVIGSMFMFRLALYLDSVKHQDAPHSLAWSTAYFFMIPNICYPLFPLVNYTTFQRTRYDADGFRIYDRGIRFLLRGIAQLLVYRLVWFYLALDSLYINNLVDVVRYIAATFLLYIKISGQFWVIIGVLGLYGFRLPETNHLYFLAASPTDFWRRINIYWKDAMMKLVYYPSFFRLRKFGNTLALVAATLMVFVITWLLHGYQGFWLQGTARLSSKRDLAFWGVFGVVVLLAVLWDERPGQRGRRKTDRSWSLARGVKTVATFCLIAMLWSLWNAVSMPTWLFMWTQTRYSTAADWALLLGLVVAGVALTGFGWGAPTLERPRADAEPIGAAARRAGGRVLAMGCLVLVAVPAIRTQLPGPAAAVVDHLQQQAVSHPGQDLLGYYEQLTTLHSRAAAPWHEPVTGGPNYWGTIMRPRRDFLVSVLAPGEDVTFLGDKFTTNRWGMRDRDFELAKPAGTYRIALLGPSDVMGWRVSDSAVFKVPLEAKLDSVARAHGQRAEVLNFAFAAASLPQQLYLLEQQVLQFSPDLILLTVHPFDLVDLQVNFTAIMRSGYSIPDTAVARLTKRVEIGPGLHGDLANLRVVEEDLDRAVFGRALELGTRAGAKVALLGLRLPGQNSSGNIVTTKRAIAAVGVPFLDCVDAPWDGRRESELRVSDTDAHPNAAGHRLTADCVFDQLTRNATTLGIRPLLPAPRAAP